MKIILRLATIDDLVNLQTLFAETIKNTCKNDYSKEQIDAWVSSVENKERWFSVLKKQYVIIAQTNDKIVGFGSLDKGSYIDFMYVHKDYLRKGIASQIYKNLKAKSIDLGHSKLTSDVSKTAKPFFESRGFKVIKENKNIRNGVEIINFHMSQ